MLAPERIDHRESPLRLQFPMQVTARVALECDVFRQAARLPANSSSSYCDQLEQARRIFTPSIVLRRAEAPPQGATRLK
jgi:hypothetical protein